ncbi:MAG TPA: glycosyltransferase family 25 protein [Phenylobacterium sp.]|jgi:GR25 family glycosyltransferase involved in LPS biosynthesis|uniref:glycosyltransferase family 25 protein n=1 Tax=Phenylobacterium sp. TaxID=1871053 RepID=UPI002BED818A|nr:glycosyltransferase family 25 protein [Phenylobacterium sp.]HXA38841.1 glycosyltransferase family 25 protein [Phenylobacterium sp.]
MKACVFINLPAAEARRRDIEASFARTAAGAWSLSRFKALGPADVAAIPGALTPAEKACFASHRTALGEHLAGDDPVLIVEDDAVFSPQAFGVLDGLLGRGGDWDLIFTDAALCDFNLMVHLAARRDGMVTRGEYLPVDLKGRSYFGATAYAVRGSSKRRVHAALAAAELNQPYDLFLRDLIHSGSLKAAVVFPFITSLSAEADGSQIQGDDTAVFDRTLNAYRRLMYVARDLDRCRADAQRLAAHTDEAARLVGAVFAAVVSPAFPLDR